MEEEKECSRCCHAAAQRWWWTGKSSPGGSPPMRNSHGPPLYITTTISIRMHKDPGTGTLGRLVSPHSRIEFFPCIFMHTHTNQEDNDGNGNGCISAGNPREKAGRKVRWRSYPFLVSVMIMIINIREDSWLSQINRHQKKRTEKEEASKTLKKTCLLFILIIIIIMKNAEMISPCILNGNKTSKKKFNSNLNATLKCVELKRVRYALSSQCFTPKQEKKFLQDSWFENLNFS